MSLIGVILWLLNFIFYFNQNYETIRVFECGIEYQEGTRIRFSFFYFYYTILFVLFDVELCCILPFISASLVIQSILIFLFLLTSTLVELYDGVLS